jgi:hypothetical protein
LICLSLWPGIVALADQAPIVKTFNKLPLAFEKNQGQAPRGVDFLARTAGYSVSLSQGNARVALRREKAAPSAGVDLRLVGARPAPIPAGRKPLPGKVNYFVGSDPTRWHTDIPTFERVEYGSVYRGIDLAYYGNQGRLEYDFIVAPGANPDAIRLAVEGASKISIDGSGGLAIETAGGSVEFQKPETYQEIGGTRRPVESRYALLGSNQICFRLGSYDHSRQLIIDPSLVYSTYLGGSNGGFAYGIAIGPNGNAFIAGYTSSMDFPTVNPEQSFYKGSTCGFVSELATDGSSLVYSTYLCGSSYDYPYSIAVDSAGSAYVAGYTSSTDFPVKNALYPTLNGPDDGFVTKLSPAGNNLAYSTYLGGSGYEYIYSIAVDAGHNTYVAGYTSSSDFPVTTGAYLASCDNCEAFVTKLSPTGTKLVWSTYFGQNYSAYVEGIAVDSKENVYLTGSTGGNLPVTAGAPQPVYGGNEDAFIAELNNTGASLTYATYLGGSQEDYGYSIAVDAGGSAFVAGVTGSTNLPVTAAALQAHAGGGYDGFVAKVNNLGTQWDYVTYLGGQRDDYAYGIAVDSAGNATVAGYTISTNFPHPSGLQQALAGNTTLLFTTASSGSTWKTADSGIPTEVNQLAADPASGAHVIAATNDGLYQTSDSGAHWLATGPAQTYFESVAFAPSGGVVYALAGNFMYSSSDNGSSWAVGGEVFTSGCYSSNEEIAVHPTTSTTLYAASGYCSSGIAKSTNGGVTWTALTGFPSGATAFSIAINPKSPDTLYAASSLGIVKSTDGGQTWTVVYSSYATVVVIDPKKPSTIYAVINDQVYVSTNAGGSWAPTGPGLTGAVSVLAVTPSNPAVLYAGTYGSGVFTTSTSGSSWSAAGLASYEVLSIAVDPTKPVHVYAATNVSPDAFVAKINPTGQKLVYGTYLGGTGYDYAYGVALNSAGDAFVTGYTQSADFPSTSGAFQAANGTYANTAFVTGISAATPACTYTASPGSYFFYPYGGSLNVSVVAPSGCAWTPKPSASWITIQSHGGPGVGPLAISIAANTGAARTGTVVIGGTSVAIKQAAGGCSYSLSTYNFTFPQTGGPASIDVTAGSGCQWVVTNLPDWLTVTSGGSGSGNGTVNLQASANPFPGIRYFYNGPIIGGNYMSVSETGTSGADVQQPRPPVPTQPPCPGPPNLCPALSVPSRRP